MRIVPHRRFRRGRFAARALRLHIANRPVGPRLTIPLSISRLPVSGLAVAGLALTRAVPVCPTPASPVPARAVATAGALALTLGSAGPAVLTTPVAVPALVPASITRRTRITIAARFTAAIHRAAF